MKQHLPLFFLLAFLAMHFRPYAQCSGSNNCSLNWDYLRFFPSAGIASYTNLATSQTQNFAFGTQRLTITHNFTGSNAAGEDGTNTAEAGALGTGNDVHFLGNGTITISFQTAVSNVRFSLFDIDYNQKLVVSTSAGNQVSMANLSGSLHTITGNNTATAEAVAGNSVTSNSNTDGTLNITITGTVSSVTITTSQTGTKTTGFSWTQERGDFWLSDISACSAGNFTTNYYYASKPFINQPGYVLVAHNNDMYYVNPSTGAAKILFTDTEHSYFNSVAYDPVKKHVYYTFTRSGPGGSINGSNKTVKRYDYNTDTFGVLINDVSNLVPVLENGVESAAAAFYDGSLYLGIEANSGGVNKSIVWKIDFDANDNPVKASQVFAIAGSTHDWADIGITNGVLYDFDGSSNKFYHQDLLTKLVTTYTASTGLIPRQTSVEWNNTLYNTGATGTGSTGTMVPYLLNGTVNTPLQKTITYNGATAIGDWGDAGEAFKPKLDFGDAPVSYDAFAEDSATHERDTALYLGTTMDIEWASNGHTSLANNDNYDDGMTGGAVFNPLSGSFLTPVKFYNNTGSSATLCAWIDFNGNGTFDAAEGLVMNNLPSSALPQTVYLNWMGIASSLTNGSYTYIRLRITSTANGMTANNPAGYFSNGEVEDYRLPVVTTTLAAELISFTAVRRENGSVAMDWKMANAEQKTVYTLQRSTDGEHWQEIAQVKAFGNGAVSALTFYSHTDAVPLKGTLYYRLKIKARGDTYGPVRMVEPEDVFRFSVFPNPAAAKVTVIITANSPGNSQIVLASANGQELFRQNVQLHGGANRVLLCCADQLGNGTYLLRVQADGKVYSRQLVIKK